MPLAFLYFPPDESIYPSFNTLILPSLRIVYVAVTQSRFFSNLFGKRAISYHLPAYFSMSSSLTVVLSGPDKVLFIQQQINSRKDKASETVNTWFLCFMRDKDTIISWFFKVLFGKSFWRSFRSPAFNFFIYMQLTEDVQDYAWTGKPIAVVPDIVVLIILKCRKLLWKQSVAGSIQFTDRKHCLAEFHVI